AFVSVAGPLKLVGALPEVEESAAMLGLHGSARGERRDAHSGRGAASVRSVRARCRWGRGGRGGFTGWRTEMPLADEVGRVAGLLEQLGKRDGVFTESDGIAPHAVLRGIRAGEDGGARGG